MSRSFSQVREGRSLPQSVGKVPCREAVAELRLTASALSAADILPGAIITHERDWVENVSALPFSAIPKDIRSKDPGLAFAATHTITRNGGVIQLGDRVVTFVSTPSYPGWGIFARQLSRLCDIAAGTLGGTLVERASLRFLNLIEVPEAHQLGVLDFEAELAGSPIPETGMVLRTEYRQEAWIDIVTVETNVAFSFGGSTTSGLKVDVDCVFSPAAPVPLYEMMPHFDQLHDRLKDRFFSLLTEETIKSLEPRYD